MGIELRELCARALWIVTFLGSGAMLIVEDIHERTVPGVCIPTGCYVSWWFFPLLAVWLLSWLALPRVWLD